MVDTSFHNTSVKTTDTSAAGIIRTAADIVEGVRNQQHGEKERSFTLIAQFWTSYLEGRKTNGPVTPTDVAQMMVLFKMARSIQGEAILDHFIDQAGYAGIAGELSQSGKSAVVVKVPVKDNTISSIPTFDGQSSSVTL
ncbi:unnamed protein product [Sphagnum jensenii]